MNRSLPSVGLYCYASKWNLFPFLPFICRYPQIWRGCAVRSSTLNRPTCKSTPNRAPSHQFSSLADEWFRSEWNFHSQNTNAKIWFCYNFSNFCTLPHWSKFSLELSSWCSTSSQYYSILRPKPLLFMNKSASDFRQILTIKTSWFCF